MAIEIERKFLVQHIDFLVDQQGTDFKQGYLNREGTTVRVRIAGEHAFLTIKGKTEGISRMEFEYAIPKADAEVMLTTLCDRSAIEKTRYVVDYADKVWEVDVFHGANQGLIVAEVELDHENEPLTLPNWVGQGVSQDARYFNSQLASYPFCQWSDKDEKTDINSPR